MKALAGSVCTIAAAMTFFVAALFSGIESAKSTLNDGAKVEPIGSFALIAAGIFMTVVGLWVVLTAKENR